MQIVLVKFSSGCYITQKCISFFAIKSHIDCLEEKYTVGL